VSKKKTKAQLDMELKQLKESQLQDEAETMQLVTELKLQVAAPKKQVIAQEVQIDKYEQRQLDRTAAHPGQDFQGVVCAPQCT
jgi:hypothetical protein